MMTTLVFIWSLLLAGVTSPQDPMQSQDLQIVNQEIVRRGFSPNVYFDYDSSALSDNAKSQLGRNAALLKSEPQLLVMIAGNCDERGTEEYNLGLGARRASAVQQYLTSLGVDASGLRTVSYGEERPVCTASNEGCWSQNRRGAMVITGRSGS